MQSFIRWNTAYNEIAGYDGVTEIDGCPMPDQYEYMMPIAPGDILSFIADAALLGYPQAGEYDVFKIGLISGCENVEYDIGTIVPTPDKRQLYCTVLIPTDLEEMDCYQLIFYKETPGSVTDWVQTGIIGCQLDSNGRQTGWQRVTQERTVGDYTIQSIAVSNHLQYSSMWMSTKIIAFRDQRNGWDYDYNNSGAFYQQVRLHVTVAEPTPVLNTSEYRQTDGVYRRGNTYIDKKRTLRTDYFDEPTHDALQVALFHYTVLIDGVSYFARGEYETDHIESKVVPDRFHPLWTASIELLVQGYNQHNNQCSLPGRKGRVFDQTFDYTFN